MRDVRGSATGRMSKHPAGGVASRTGDTSRRTERVAARMPARLEAERSICWPCAAGRPATRTRPPLPERCRGLSRRRIQSEIPRRGLGRSDASVKKR